MQVSVIIPVYNASQFVRQAVESAVTQAQTSEVILVEDGSSDNSWELCNKLSEEFNLVQFFQHPDGKNHGPGATRNLGILKSNYQYISFLDADDFYLPQRFSTAEQLFSSQSYIDGIYEAVGYHYENSNQVVADKLTTMSEEVPPGELFEKQSPIGNYGYCPTGGWVVKKSIFDKTGLFDENLRLHQDTAMYIKFAAVGTMVAGNLRVPVAMRRIHDANRITASRSPVENYNNQLLMWKSLWKWGKKNLDFHKKRILMRKFLNHSASGVELYNSRKYTALFHYIKLLKHDPTLLFEYYYWRRMIGISIKCLKV